MGVDLNKIKMKLRIEEAIAKANYNGRKVKKKDIASRIFEGASEVSQAIRMTSLINGNTRRVDPEWVLTICEMCDVTPNYLFGVED